MPLIGPRLHLIYPSNLRNSPHRQLNHSKGASAHRHSPQQRRSQPLPKATRALSAPRLAEAIIHAVVPLSGAEAIALHLALDDIERIGSEPEGLAGQAAVPGDLPAGNVAARDAVARRVGVHEVLKGEEPDAVGLGFA